MHLSGSLGHTQRLTQSVLRLELQMASQSLGDEVEVDHERLAPNGGKRSAHGQRDARLAVAARWTGDGVHRMKITARVHVQGVTYLMHNDARLRLGVTRTVGNVRHDADDGRLALEDVQILGEPASRSGQAEQDDQPDSEPAAKHHPDERGAGTFVGHRRQGKIGESENADSSHLVKALLHSKLVQACPCLIQTPLHILGLGAEIGQL